MNLNADVGLAVLVDNLEGEVLDVILNRLVLELLTDETLLQRLLVIVSLCGKGAQLTMSKTVR